MIIWAERIEGSHAWANSIFKTFAEEASVLWKDGISLLRKRSMLYMELRWKSCDDLLDEKETHQNQCTAFLNLNSIGSISYFFTVI